MDELALEAANTAIRLGSRRVGRVKEGVDDWSEEEDTAEESSDSDEET